MPRPARPFQTITLLTPFLGPLGEQRCFRSIWHLNYTIPFIPPFIRYPVHHEPRVYDNARSAERPHGRVSLAFLRGPYFSFFFFFFFFRPDGSPWESGLPSPLSKERWTRGTQRLLSKSWAKGCSIRLTNAGEHSFPSWVARLIFARYLSRFLHSR